MVGVPIMILRNTFWYYYARFIHRLSPKKCVTLRVMNVGHRQDEHCGYSHNLQLVRFSARGMRTQAGRLQKTQFEQRQRGSCASKHHTTCEGMLTPLRL